MGSSNVRVGSPLCVNLKRSSAAGDCRQEADLADGRKDLQQDHLSLKRSDSSSQASLRVSAIALIARNRVKSFKAQF
jgi:hypothetical protein